MSAKTSKYPSILVIANRKPKSYNRPSKTEESEAEFLKPNMFITSEIEEIPI